MKAVLLDSNVFGDETEMPKILAWVRRTGRRLVVPATALIEWCKQPDAQERRRGLRRAFWHLRRDVDLVVATEDLGRLFLNELMTLKPNSGDRIISSAMSEMLPRLIEEVYCQRGPIQKQFYATMGAQYDAWKDTWWNHKESRRVVLRRSEDWHELLRRGHGEFLAMWKQERGQAGLEGGVHNFRAAIAGAFPRLAADRGVRLMMAESAHVDLDHAVDLVVPLCRARSVLLALTLAEIGSEMMWTPVGGAPRDRRPEKFTNDQADFEYVALALAGVFLS